MPSGENMCAAHPGCATGSMTQGKNANRDMIAALRMFHEKKKILCRELENIADCLPDRVNAVACLDVAANLLPTLIQAHDYEEKVVFPAFEQLVATTAKNVSTDRLRAEHISDECFAADLTGILLQIGHGGCVGEAETFGFMLRGFFDGLRRHVAFENEYIAPIVGKEQLSTLI